MALQFIDGFDGIDVLGAFGADLEDTAGLKYKNAELSTSPTPDLETGRLGTGLALRWDSDTSKYLDVAITGSPTTLVIGFAYKTPTQQNSNKLWTLRNSSNGEIASLYISSSNRLEVRLGSTGIAFSSELLVSGSWYYIEWKHVCHASSGSTEIRVNGETVASATGVDTQSSAPPIDYVRFSGQDANSVLDDIYILDITGGVNDDFLGPCLVESLLPNADTGDVDFTPSEGTDHYALVAEVPCDLDTTYLDSSTTGHKDIWAYENISEIDGAVHGVMVWTCAAAPSGSYTLRTVADDGTTEDADSGFMVSTTTFVGLLRLMDQTPSAGSWSTALVNGSSFGVEVG